VACITVFVGDMRMGSKTTRAVEVWLRRIQPNGPGSTLCQGQRYGARAAADIQYSVARLDAGKVEEGLRQTGALGTWCPMGLSGRKGERLE
jgi:hypothetical protein